MLFFVLHHDPMDAETHTTHPENKNRRSFSMEIRCLGGRGLHTNKSIAQIFFRVAFAYFNEFCWEYDGM
jgi:hypothetical protein